MAKKQRNYFDGKTCFVCKRPASTYHYVNGKFAYLCDNKQCSDSYDRRVGLTHTGIELPEELK